MQSTRAVIAAQSLKKVCNHFSNFQRQLPYSYALTVHCYPAIPIYSFYHTFTTQTHENHNSSKMAVITRTDSSGLSF